MREACLTFQVFRSHSNPSLWVLLLRQFHPCSCFNGSPMLQEQSGTVMKLGGRRANSSRSVRARTDTRQRCGGLPARSSRK